MGIEASPRKLKDGTWGAATTKAVAPGDTLTVRTKAGKTWEAVVDRVVWSNQSDAWIVSTRSIENSPRRRGGCHTDGDCSSLCRQNGSCPCWDGGWFTCC